MITSLIVTIGLNNIKLYPNPSSEIIFIETLLMDFDLNLMEAYG